MAQKFSLSAQLQLLPPTNVRAVVQNINNQLRGINSNININANIPTGFTKQLASISRSAKSVKKDLGDAGDELEKFGDAAALALRRFTAFAISTKIVFGFTDAIREGIKAASQFETELVKVRSASGNSARDLKGLTDEVARLSKLYGVSSLELIKVSRILVQAGLNAQDTKKSLDALAKTDLVGTFGSLEDAGDGVIAFMTQFGVKAGDLEKRLSQINAVAKQTAVEAEDIVVAFKKAGGSFKAAGGSFEELIALLTSVRATTRESADSIATGFRTIFGRIQRPKTIAFLRDMNIELEKSGKFVGPYAAIQKLGEALAKLDSTDLRFASIVEELGGIRQLSKVIPLIQQTALQQKALNIALISTADLSEDAARAQGTLARESAKVAENFSQFVRDVYNGSPFQTLAKDAIKLADALISIGEALKPIQSFIGAGIGIAGISAIAKIGKGFTQRISGRQNLTGNSLFLSSGGPIRHGSGVKDDVPAVLKRGEYVISQKGVQSVGTNYLNDLNAGKVKKFSQGGPTEEEIRKGTINEYRRLLKENKGPKGPRQLEDLLDLAKQNSIIKLQTHYKEMSGRPPGGISSDKVYVDLVRKEFLKLVQSKAPSGIKGGVVTRAGATTPTDLAKILAQAQSNVLSNSPASIEKEIQDAINRAGKRGTLPGLNVGDLSTPPVKIGVATDLAAKRLLQQAELYKIEQDELAQVKIKVSGLGKANKQESVGSAAKKLLVEAERKRSENLKKNAQTDIITFPPLAPNLTGPSITGRRAGILSRLSPELQGIALSEFNQQKQTPFLPSVESKPFKLTKKLEAQAEQLVERMLLPILPQQTTRGTQLDIDQILPRKNRKRSPYSPRLTNAEIESFIGPHQPENLALTKNFGISQDQNPSVILRKINKLRNVGKNVAFNSKMIPHKYRAALDNLTQQYEDLVNESEKQSKLSTKVTQGFRNFFGGPSGPSGPVPPGGPVGPVGPVGPSGSNRGASRFGKLSSAVKSGINPGTLSIAGLGLNIISQSKLVGADKNNETTRQIQDFTSNLAASSLVLSILPSTLTKSVDRVRDSLSQQTEKLNSNKNKLSDVERQISVSRLRGTTGTNKFQNLLAEQSLLTSSITSQERGFGKTKAIEARLARRQRQNSLTGFIGGVGISTASAISGSFERQSDQQLESGNTEGFRRSRGFSGALSGAATGGGIGLSLGLMTGNPAIAAFGAVVGAAGGAVYGFKKSIEEAADQIKSTEFNKSFDTFVRRLDKSFQAGLPGQQVLSIKSELERAKSNFLSGSPETRETIRGRIKGESSKILNVLTAFAGTGGGKNANIENVIKNLSFFTDIPVEELSKRFDESALAMSKHIDISNKLNQYLEKSVTEFIKLNQVIQSFESASSSVIDNRARTNTLGEFAGGNIGRTTSPFGPISRGGGIFLDSGRLNREAGKTAGLFGNSSPTILKSFTEASVAMNRLPDALLQILGQDRLGGDNFQSAFKDFGPIGGKIVEILRQDVIGNTEDPNKLRDELKTNFAGVLSKVGEKIFDPIANIFNSANSQISSEVDAYIKGVGEIRQNQARIVGIFDNILSLTEQTERVRASLEDRKVNTGLLGRVESARGRNILGGLTGTPDALADRNLLARTRILDLETKLREGSVKATKEVISALEGERTVLEKTTAGLRYLGDVSGRIGALQERLGQVRGKRELATDIAGEFAFGDRGSRKALVNTLTIIRGLAFSSSKGRRISTDLIPEKSRGDVDALLSKIGDETFGGLFSKTGKGLREELIKSSVGPAGLKEITKSAEEKSLEKQITDAFDIGVKAMEKLASIEEVANKKYVSELSATFDKFINNLNTSLSATEIVNLERDVAAAKSKNFETKSAVDIRTSLPFAPDVVTELAKLTKQGTLGQLVSNVSAISGQQKTLKSLSIKPNIDIRNDPVFRGGGNETFGSFGKSTSLIKDENKFQEFIFNKLKGQGINSSISDKLSGNITKIATARQNETNLGFKRGLEQSDIDSIIAEQLAVESKNLSASIKDTQQQFSDITSTLGLSNAELNNIIKNFGTIGKTLNEIDPSISLRSLQEQSLAAGYALQQLTAQLYGLKSGTPVAKAAGGHIPGVGNRDTVPARLTPGEFVVKKSSANSIGRDALDHMNMYGEIPFAVGGRVERMQRRQAYLAARSARRSAFTGTREQNRASYLDSKYIAPDVDITSFNLNENPIQALARLKYSKPSRERTRLSEYFRGKIREGFGKSVKTARSPAVSSKLYSDLPVAPTVTPYDPTAWRKDMVYPEIPKKVLPVDPTLGIFDTPKHPTAAEIPDVGGYMRALSDRVKSSKEMLNKPYDPFRSGKYITTNPLSIDDQLRNKGLETLYDGSRLKSTIAQEYNDKLKARLPRFGGFNSSLRGFANGGPVPGIGNKDSIPANLMPGEYVLRKQAAQAIGKPKLDQMNRQGFANGGSVGESVNMSGFNESITQLNSTFGKFATNSERLAQALDSFPREISLSGHHTVEVIINGAQVMTNIMPEVSKLIESQTKSALNNMLAKKFPEVGQM